MTPPPVNIAIGQGETLPLLAVVITQPTGAPMTLAGAAVRFLMRSLQSAKPKVNAVATVVTAAAGSVHYAWTATDTATAGLFMGSFAVTTAGGATYSFPNGGYLTIEVDASLIDAPMELVSLADAHSVLNLPATDHTRDQKALGYVRAACEAIEDITGPLIPRRFEEWHDGGQVFISLRRRPSTALGTTPMLILQAISEYQGPIEWPLQIIPTPTLGQLFSAQLTIPLCRVVRRTAGGGVQAFPGMPQAVHVIYTAGQNVIPQRVYEATLEVVRENFQQTQQGKGRPSPTGGPSGGGGGGGQPGPGAFVSNRVKQMLGLMRKYPAFA